MSSNNENTIIKLCANNYLHWKLSVNAVLEGKGLQEYVDGTFPCPTTGLEETRVWKKKDALAKTVIINSVDTEHVNLIINAKTSKEMYDAIINHREQKTIANEWTIKRKLADLTFTASHTVLSYLSELDTIIKQLEDIGTPIDEKTKMIKILTDLPISYASLKQNINIAVNAGIDVSYANLRGQLLTHESEMKRDCTEKTNGALVVKKNNVNKKKKRCYGCHGIGHVQAQCRYNPNNQSNNNFQNMPNNNSRNYNNNRNNNNFRSNNFPTNSNNSQTNFNNHNGRNNNNRNFNRNANFNNNFNRNNNFNNNFNRNNNFNNNNRGQSNFNNQAQFIAQNSEPQQSSFNNSNQTNNHNDDNFSLCCVQQNNKKDVWLLDTGASFHLTNNINHFCKFKELCEPIILTIGNGDTITGIAKGDIEIECFDGSKWNPCILHDVVFAPKLGDFNLFSWGQSSGKGLALISDSKGTRIVKESTNKTIVTAEKIKTTYKLNIRFKANYSNLVLTVREANLSLWHRRLGHINVRKIMEMSKHGILPRIEGNVDDFMCDGCLKGKMTRQPFKTVQRREYEVGEVMHADLQGTMEVPSIGGSRYALVIKDDKSQFRTVFFLKFKSNSFNSIEAYVGYVKRVTGAEVKVLRTDNGTEFTDQRVKNFLESNNIAHELTAPYCPEQNGKIERENRTITELARSMIHARGLPTDLWAEAMATAVYCLNIIPLKNSNNITPYEYWYKEKPCYDNLHEFGSVVYVHIPDNLRKKWEAKSKRCYFVGYTKTKANFKVYDPVTENIGISKNVKFQDERDDSSVILKPFDEIVNTEDIIDQPEQELINNDQANGEIEEDTIGHDKDEDNDRNNVILHALAVIGEPINYEDVLISPDKEKWLQAMKDEMQSLKKNNTYELVYPPKGTRVIGCRWVYRIKRNLDGSVDRYKARLVAQGFSQRSGIDYFDTFSPVARYDSIRAILAIACSRQMHLLQFDVKTAFLYGELNEEIFMAQPEGFKNNTTKVLKLKKGLYGLKQAPRQWNMKIGSFFTSNGFTQSQADHCIYFKKTTSLTICLIYVDDGLIASTDHNELTNLTKKLATSFEMKFGKPNVFVGMEITQSLDRSSITIKQTCYIKDLLKRFNMNDCKPVSTPGDSNVKLAAAKESPNKSIPYQEAVGALLYLSIISRPDITHQVSKASQYNACYNETHWIAIKRILRYLKGTMHVGIKYSFDPCRFDLIGYCDADYAADIDTRKSTSGFIVTLGSSPVSWASRLQRTVAQSTTEAEYIAIADCTKDILWFITLLKEINIKVPCPIPIYSDNQGAILLTRNTVYHRRTKHIDVRYHFIRDHQEKGNIIIQYVPTNEQPADMLTKSLCAPSLSECIEKLRIGFY